jgi:solute carrier family 45 protein 1/2/4
VTGLSSIIFAIFEPDKSVLHGSHPGKTIPPGNGTVPAGGVGAVSNASVDATQLLASRGLDFVQNADSLRFGRREETEAGVNSVAIIFRVGGFAAMIACALTWRLARELKKAR